jgi:hypothetical protein
MQLSTLNAYPSAVPVPKEIFADVLHALPLRSFNHHTRWKVCAAGVFQVFTTTVRIVLKCGLGVSECARRLHAGEQDARSAWEAVLLLRSGCDAGELVSERLFC